MSRLLEWVSYCGEMFDFFETFVCILLFFELFKKCFVFI